VIGRGDFADRGIAGCIEEALDTAGDRGAHD